MEIWKEIKNTKNKYKISNKGNFMLANGKITKGSPDKNGYLRVLVIYINGNKTKKVHRLVAEYFLENYSENLTVNHKDLDKSNNTEGNLEMLTDSENVIHYQENVVQKKAFSNYRGIGFHTGLNKWVSRITINKKRYNLGVYNTEEEAKNAYQDYYSGKIQLKIGKGSQNIGKSKYTEQQFIDALNLAKVIGVRKAGVITGMGSTKISLLRTKFEFINGEYKRKSS